MKNINYQRKEGINMSAEYNIVLLALISIGSQVKTLTQLKTA